MTKEKIKRKKEEKMANSKLIIVEGPQGAGKTTVTDFLRYKIPYTNLYRLNGTGDSSENGKEKAKVMYTDLVDYIEKLQNKNINLVFDRTFFTEEVYCRLGFKDYSFTDVYEDLLNRIDKMDFETYFINIHQSYKNEFEKRLSREGKVEIKYAKFSKESSINQQNAYLEVAKEIKEKCSNIKVVELDTCIGIDNVKEKIMEILK